MSIQTYRVCYYVHNERSRYLDLTVEKYGNILFRSEAQDRAKALLKQLKAYYIRHLHKRYYTIQTMVVDNDSREVFDRYE